MSSVFQTRLWLSCWMAHYGRGLEWVDGSGPDAEGFPLVAERRAWRGVPVRVWRFPENGHTLHNDARGDPVAAVEALCRRLRTQQPRWTAAVLAKVPKDAPVYGLLRRRLVEVGFRLVERPGPQSPYISVKEPWDAFWGRRSAKSRKTLRNVLNRSTRNGCPAVEEVSTPERWAEVWPEVLDVARSSWSHGVGDSVASERNRAFFEELSRAASKAGWLRLWILRLGQTAVAVEYHLVHDGRAYGLRGFYRESCGDWSPGAVLDYHVVRRYFEPESGVREYDLGGSDDFYKRRWTRSIRRHVTFHIFHGGVRSRLLHAYEHRAVASARWARDRWRDRRGAQGGRSRDGKGAA